MLKVLILFIILSSSLIYLRPAESEIQNEMGEITTTYSTIADSIPCTELQITRLGVVCKSGLEIVARLDFPEVDLKGALAGRESLPSAQAVFTADEKTVGDKTYRNIALLLRWEPATPEFLQIYLNEYVPYWGNRVPYRLFWNAQYEVCSIDHCTEWLTVSEMGEFLPSDVKDLSSDLAADVNFNGVPAAFWNTHLIP
jgi:hypothetical protein